MQREGIFNSICHTQLFCKTSKNHITLCPVPALRAKSFCLLSLGLACLQLCWWQHQPLGQTPLAGWVVTGIFPRPAFIFRTDGGRRSWASLPFAWRVLVEPGDGHPLLNVPLGVGLAGFFPHCSHHRAHLRFMPGLSTVMTFLIVKVFPKSHRLMGSGHQRRSRNDSEKFLLMSWTGTIFFLPAAHLLLLMSSHLHCSNEWFWMAAGVRRRWKGVHLPCGPPVNLLVM